MVDDNGKTKKFESDTTEPNKLSLKDLATFPHLETLEPFKHSKVAEKFKHIPNEYTLLDNDSLPLNKILQSFSSNEKIFVTVFTDFVPHVLVEPVEDSTNKTTYSVADEKTEYVFLSLQRTKGILEILPLDIKVKHEEDMQGKTYVSSQYWSCTARVVFHADTTVEELTLNEARKKKSFDYETVQIVNKGTNEISIKIFHPES